MRLIDADELKEDIEQQCALLRLMKDNDELIQISLVLESGFMAQIDKMPTIEERKKGEWINEGIYGEGHSERAIRCSNCDWHYIGYLDDYKFCPNCGADMRGD